MAGRPKDVSDREILAAITDLPEDIASTSQVRDQIDLEHEGTLKRLKKLAAAGVIEGRKLPNGWLWSLTHDGIEFLDSGAENIDT